MAIRTALFLIISVNIHLGICDEPSRKLPELGRGMREEFFFEPDFVELNHGSYGPYSKVVGQSFLENQIRAERNPDLWLRRDAKKELVKIRQMVGELISADPEDIVMVPSTTSGMNAILRSIVFKPGERILHLSTLFTANKKLVQFLIDYSKGTLSKVVFNAIFPMTNEEFLEKFEQFLKEIEDPKQPIRIAIIEAIPCVPGVKLPIERAIPMLKHRNIPVILDGAHALGQIPINITDLAPDYFVSNGHKWLLTARGCSVLYVDKKHQTSIHPAHINSGYKKEADFQNEFYLASTSTMDLSAYMTVPTALQFRRDAGGEDVVMQYNHNLAWEGGKYLASQFGTRVMQNKDQLGAMVDVQLPLDNPQDPQLNVEWWIDEQLFKHPNTFSSVYYHNGHWWVRVAAQIYNDMSDFEVSAKHFLDICGMLNSSQNKTARRR